MGYGSGDADRMVVLAGFVVALGGVLVGTSGCFTNACLLTVCDGPYCRCSVSTCGEGAAYDTRRVGLRACRTGRSSGAIA